MLKRLSMVGILCLLLSGCAGVLAVGGAVSDIVVDNFKGLEMSMPVKMSVAMAAVQKGLKATDFSLDVIEFVDAGYLVSFKNGELVGLLKLSKTTRKITTLYIKIKSASGVVREESVEKTVLDVIDGQAKKIRKSARFHFAGYNYIRAKPTVLGKKLGRYKRGAKLKLHRSPNKSWLRFKMPSGKNAFLKGKLPTKSKVKNKPFLNRP